MRNKGWKIQEWEWHGECGDDVAAFNVQNAVVKKTKEMIK